MIENFFRVIMKKDKNGWKPVIYPPPISKRFFGFIPLKIVLLIIIIILESIIIVNISEFNIFKNNITQILITIFYFYLIYKTIVHYMRFQKNRQEESNSLIEKRLVYLIHSLKLYDEEMVGIGSDKEKRIVRTIQIMHREDDKRVYVRILKLGNRFNKIAPTLGENIESTLGLELDRTNSTVDYFDYILLKEKDRRIDLRESISNQHNNSDVINISGNISYRLSNPHSLIVGGTGSGKSFFILGKIVSYLSLTPQAELYIVDPKKADLSLLRFIGGMEEKVVTEPNQIAKMLREVVEIMEDRYKTYFNNISAFGKDYTDFGLSPVILIFDEFSAFIHSVDKKLSKEVLDYIFTIVMKGRQAGVQVEILMQRPSADDLPTNIRAQMGFKAGLGAMDKIGYNMIFDTNDVDFKTVTEKGGGYIQIDGVHTAPVYFETPYIDKEFDFIQEITKLIENKKQQ